MGHLIVSVRLYGKELLRLLSRQSLMLTELRIVRMLDRKNNGRAVNNNFEQRNMAF